MAGQTFISANLNAKAEQSDLLGGVQKLEDTMRNLNMSREDKKKMMQEFMNSMTDEEKAEMTEQSMPKMMNECMKTMAEMQPGMQEKCKKMMEDCMKADK